MDTVCEQAVNGAVAAVYNWSMAAEPKTFGERVAWLLRRRRTDTLPISSQKELAAAMRVSPQYLNALMGGRRTPNVQHLRTAAAALGTSVSYLALATDDPSPDVAADEVYDDEDGAGISPAAAEAASLVDGMPPDLREIALDLLKVLLMHAEDETDPTRRAGGVSGRLILGKLLKDVKKSAGLPVRPNAE